MSISLAELAQRFGATVRGDGTQQISGVATLEAAGPQDLAFLMNSQYQGLLAKTRAGAVVLSPADAERFPGNALVTSNPHLCFARIADLLHPQPDIAPGVHPRAVVDGKAHVASSAHIGALAVVEAGARIEARAVVGPGCYVAAGAIVGESTRLVAQVYLGPDCVVGRRCLIHPGAIVGADGFGYARDGERWVKVPQLGRVVIGDDVDIGANTTVDRGALGDTIIADGVKLDNLIQIAHNVQIGEHTAMAGCVGVAGSAVIGKRCTIGGGAGVAGHLKIADDVHITGTSLISGSISKPGSYSSAISAEEAAQWRKNAARLRRLDELAKRVKKLEEKLEKLIEGVHLE